MDTQEKKPKLSDMVADPLSSLAGIRILATEDLELNGEVVSADVYLRVEQGRVWMEAIDLITEAESQQDEPTWFLHICKRFLRSKTSGDLSYVWHIGVTAEPQTTEGTKAAVRELQKVLVLVARQLRLRKPIASAIASDPAVAEAPPAAMQPRARHPHLGGRVVDGEVVSMPLVGVGSDRSNPINPVLRPGSRGAHPIRMGR